MYLLDIQYNVKRHSFSGQTLFEKLKSNSEGRRTPKLSDLIKKGKFTRHFKRVIIKTRPYEMPGRGEGSSFLS